MSHPLHRDPGRTAPPVHAAAERGILPDVTIDELVAAIRALPVRDRLRVIELVEHDAANDAPVTDAEAVSQGSVILTERHGLLLVDTEAAVPEGAFDHRVDREARADRIWSSNGSR